MKSNKHLQKKQEIIDTAFKIWSENGFFSTSLNDIAESLQITKQAIYRYFKNKQELLYCMEDQVVEHYRENSDKILKKIETLPKEKIVKIFIMNQISYFKQHKIYIVFLISKTRMKGNDRNAFKNIIKHQNNYLIEKLGFPQIAINYLGNLIAFYMMIGKGTEDDEKICSQICGILQNGFATELLPDVKQAEEILQKSKIFEEYDDNENDKVLNAISEVVIEEGPEKASMGNIAKKAGMTKSSLYFYFKNKKEMINETINGQTELFVDYYYKMISEYEDIAQQLFAHFAMTGSMIIEKPKAIPLIHWFINRGMAEELKKPTDFEKYRLLFENAFNYKYLETYGITADHLIMLVNFCIMYEINNEYRAKLKKDEKYELIYNLYNLIMYGLKGLEKDMT